MQGESEREFWPDWLCRAMAGLDAGVWATAPLLVWFCVLGQLRDRLWWSYFNVAAWPLFGDRVYWAGLSKATLVGACGLLLLYGTLGVLLGLWFRPDSYVGLMARALILGLAWHFFADRYFWHWVTPDAERYFSAGLVLPGHLAWAVMLVRYRRRYEAMGRSFGDPELWEQNEPEMLQEPESGELAGEGGPVAARETPDGEAKADELAREREGTAERRERDEQ